jgi:hypothetical protein
MVLHATDMASIAELMIVDYTKTGVLTPEELESSLSWAADMLDAELSRRQAVLVIAPLLESSFVENGEAGERLRIEKKLRAKGFEPYLVSLIGLSMERKM